LGSPSTRSKTSSRTFGVRARARARRASKVGGRNAMAALCRLFDGSTPRARRRCGRARERLGAVCVGGLHARESAKGAFHSKERVERIVRRQVAGAGRADDLLDRARRVVRVVDGARQESDLERLRGAAPPRPPPPQRPVPPPSERGGVPPLARAPRAARDARKSPRWARSRGPSHCRSAGSRSAPTSSRSGQL